MFMYLKLSKTEIFLFNQQNISYANVVILILQCLYRCFYPLGGPSPWQLRWQYRQSEEHLRGRTLYVYINNTNVNFVAVNYL
jgi:hypothetical protein